MGFFSDLVELLGKLLTGVKSLAGLPKEERDKYRSTIEETYRLLDAALTMIVVRLGDILLEDEPTLRAELRRLGNWDEWLKVEREFRLCRSLRIAVREAEGLPNRIRGALSVADWASFVGRMQDILAAESEIALYISQKFEDLASKASTEPLASLKEQAKSLRDTAAAERQALITQEAELYSVV